MVCEVEEPKNTGIKILLVISLALIILGGTLGYNLMEAGSGATAAVESEELAMEFLDKDIYIDGVLVNNYQLYRPIVTCNGQIYVPATKEMCSALGISVIYSENTDNLYVVKTAEQGAGEGAYYVTLGWNLADFTGVTQGETSLVFRSDMSVTDGSCDESTAYSDLRAILACNPQCYYLPLTLLAHSKTFQNISYYQEDVTGLYISTNAEIDATCYYAEENYKYIMARVAYMQYNCRSLTTEEAIFYEYVFRHEANVTGLTEDFIMSIAKGENSFDMGEYTETKALGTMQIMPYTARGNGYEPADLYNIHSNVEFGAWYIKNFVYKYNGDVAKALSAYNRGAGAVSSDDPDNPNRVYANYILNIQNVSREYYAKHGSGTYFIKTLTPAEAPWDIESTRE